MGSSYRSSLFPEDPMPLPTTLLEPIVAQADAFTAVRRDLHAHPELCFEERRTSDLVAQLLTEWGIHIHTGLGTTGVIGIIRGGQSNRAEGQRADMDGLPVTEFSTFGHASVTKGKLHACGHDGHTTMLLSAAHYLARHRNFDGTIYLIFQPAEEGGGGAREMIMDGLFDQFPMEAVFGIHTWPGLEAGQFALNPGPAFASCIEFKITFKGMAAHAAMPHNG